MAVSVSTPLSPFEKAVLAQVAATLIPAGQRIDAGGEVTVERLERLLAAAPGAVTTFARVASYLMHFGSLPRHARPLSWLGPEARERYLREWSELPYPLRLLPRGLFALLKSAHFMERQVFEGLDCRWRVDPVAEEKPARTLEQVVESDGGPELELEANVIVVGSGAGGAVVAKELAELGYAVIMVEEGLYFRRKDFTGQAISMNQLMYRDGGMTFTVGNAAILLPQGRTVGGTTTINSGTCYRAPEKVFESWRREAGLVEFTSDSMAPHFERVERVMGVAAAQEAYLGGVARIIRRGCERMGIEGHGPLLRNAPECDGQGVCCFGCPTDAKRGANVTYVPMALQRGALLLSGFKVTQIEMEGGRIAGVVAQGAPGADGRRQRARLRAPAVVLACGTIQTPALLLRMGLANGSGQLGRNLSIHPAASAVAEFEEVIHAWDSIPQGYAIEAFHDEGMLFEGAFVPLDVLAGLFPFHGRPYVELMERYNHLAAFGFLVKDTSRGRVLLGPGGKELVLYHLNKQDRLKLQKGLEILARIYFAAGARKVVPGVRNFDILTEPAQLEGFRNARLKASDFELSAYHPLGTARMGADPHRSVVGPTHECHDHPGLYIVDGSCIPSSLGVNPMLTIMAMATRAAGVIAAQLED